jgi:transcriptional regulator with XRE-family HTH domain
MEAGNGRRKEFGRMLRQHRLMIPMTLHELTVKSGVSPSYLGRIERGERFPSAIILQRIAPPLGFDVDELFTLAGYLSTQPTVVPERSPVYSGDQLDPYAYRILCQEPIAVQRAVIGIVSILRSIAKVDSSSLQ